MSYMRDISGVRLDSIGVAPAGRAPIGNRLAVLGDSLVAGGVDGGTWGMAWPLWMQALSDGRIQVVHYDGRPGKRTDEVNTGIDGVIASDATVCVYGAGTNDIQSGIAQATIRANIGTAITRLRDAGVQPIMVTLPPHNTSAYSTPILQLNAWIRWYAVRNRIPLVDFYPLLVDPTNGTYLSTYLSDGIHPNNAGYYAMGQLAWAVLGPGLPPAPAPLTRRTADATNLLSGNALFLNDSNADGVPDGWTAFSGTSGFTHSLVTGDTTISGNWAQVALSSAAADRVLQFTQSSGIVPGNRIAVAGKLAVSGYSSGNGATVKVEFASTTGTTVYPAYRWRVNASGFFYQESVIPAGATGITLGLVVGAGTVTARLAQPTILDMTALGLV